MFNIEIIDLLIIILTTHLVFVLVVNTMISLGIDIEDDKTNKILLKNLYKNIKDKINLLISKIKGK